MCTVLVESSLLFGAGAFFRVCQLNIGHGTKQDYPLLIFFFFLKEKKPKKKPHTHTALVHSVTLTRRERFRALIYLSAVSFQLFFIFRLVSKCVPKTFQRRQEHTHKRVFLYSKNITVMLMALSKKKGRGYLTFQHL